MDNESETVQYEERTFTGALKYDTDSKELYREHDAEREYFGEPSILIEDAWDRLLHDEFVPMTIEEAAPFEPELTVLPWEGNFFFELASPDVLHSLHCINGLRKELSQYMYNSSATVSSYSSSDLAHLEHCMDRLRQSIMCHGDLTPSPLYTWPDSPIALGRSGAHTCRKWEPIREWLDDRKVRGEQV
ncbi:hypothetical protein PRZ48_012627 [Zasmidium cellare]|uniref:Uncharacterized protein n=1 Tax=Zasmidium cellare TaxID=395010 RepID=A0ABR0E5X9_ZASCE|nr:hypothetical protein PRZ48_012627 [Zasmidium cellare]